MDTEGITCVVDNIARHYTLETARTPQQMSEAFRLRYQVYCVERGFEPGAGGEERDEYDSRSAHVILRQNSNGQVIGTARVVGPNPADLRRSFPMQTVCDPTLLVNIPFATTGEISRVALSRQRRAGQADITLLRLALFRGVVQLSATMGLTHWLAVLERSMLRLNERNAIHFQSVGPLVSFHGLRQPTASHIPTTLERIRTEQFLVWDFLTASGKWCVCPPPMLQVA